MGWNRRLSLVVALVGWSLATARDADACECGEFDAAAEAAVTERSDVVFDGWVLTVPNPWKCPVPPAPKPKAGCVRIAVVDAATCKPQGDLMGLKAADGTAVDFTSIDHDATTFCKVKPGTYVVTARETWIGEEDGTVNSGRTLDVVPGASYVVFWSARRGQTMRVGVARTLKGEVPREVTVVSKNECGTAFHTVGEAVRFFGTRNPDGTVLASGCSGDRALTDQERGELVTASAPTVTASPQQPASVTKPKSTSGGCTTSLPTSPWLAIALLAIRRRRS